MAEAGKITIKFDNFLFVIETCRTNGY